MLCFFTLKIRKYLISLILISCVFVRAKNVGKQRYIGLRGCDAVSALEYECCASISSGSLQGDYCLDFRPVPNELTLNVDLKIDDEVVYSGKIDPSIAPLCPPPSPVCLAVNHVNLASREICTKLILGPITLVKFPCFGVTDGRIVIVPNSYVRK